MESLFISVERVILGRSLTSLFQRERGRALHLIVRSLENSARFVASGGFARLARKQGVPLRVQSSISLSIITVFFAFIGFLFTIIGNLDIIKVHSIVVLSGFITAILAKCLGEVLERGEENLDDAITRLVATDGVVFRSVDKPGDPLPQEGSRAMPERDELMPFSLEEFRKILHEENDTLEEKTALSILAVKEDFENSGFYEKLEFTDTSSISSRKKARH